MSRFSTNEPPLRRPEGRARGPVPPRGRSRGPAAAPAPPPGILNVVVIGIGNEYRCDDGAGVICARALRDISADSITVLEHHREGTGLMDLWSATDAVFLVDALSSGSKPGSIVRLDLLEDPIADIPFRHSTHSISIADAVGLARAMGRLPAKLIIYGIEGRSFAAGEYLSPEVARAVPRAAGALLGEVRAMQAGASPVPPLASPGAGVRGTT